MQLIHHSRAHLHQAMPMPQQLPQIAILGVRHPDARKAILQHQLQYELRILPIRLLLAYSLRPYLRGISDHNSKPSSCSKRSNQRECPLVSIPTRADRLRCLNIR